MKLQVQSGKMNPKIAHRIVCPPDLSKIKAVMWGVRNEKKALQVFESATKQKSFPSGFIIYDKYNFIGVSPDGITEDGSAVIEIKCPYSIRNDMASNSIFIKNGSLVKNHPYYTQVQLQMLVAKKQEARFIVWTKNSIFIEHINLDLLFAENIVKNLVTYYEQIFAKEYFKLKWK